jgi:signal transduction histidine kinase
MKTRYYLFLLFCLTTVYFTLTPSLFAQSLNLDSLENVLKTQKLTATERLEIYEHLSTAYLEINLPKAILYAKEGTQLAEEEKNKDMAALLYQRQGRAYIFSNQFDSAKISLDKALEYAKLNQDSEREVEATAALGMMYNRQQSFPEALEYFMKALAYYENKGMEMEASRLLSNIGTVYENTNNHEKALEYMHRAEKSSRKLGDKLSLGKVLANMSSIYATTLYNEYDRALEYAEEAESIFRILGNLNGQAAVTQRFVVIYIYHKQDYQKALEWAEKGLHIAKELGSDNQAAWSLGQIAMVYYRLGRYKDCINAGLKAVQIDSTDNTAAQIAYGYMALATACMNDKVQALDYLNRFYNAVVSTTNEDFQRSFSEMEVKYETEKKEFQITAMKEERQFIIWLSIAGGVILVLVLAFFIIRQRLAVNKRKLAEQQIKQLEQEKQLLATQAVLDSETAERTRLARDLHDGLGGMLSVVKLNLNDVKKGASMEGEEVTRFNQALNVLEEAVHELRRVAHNLMPDSLTRYGLKVSLNDFCNSIPIAEFHYFGKDNRLDQKLEVVLYRTAHELVNNALKHAGANRIVVQIVHEVDRLALTVQDDGCGFDVSAKTTGTGLHNIRNRIALYDGRIDIWSKPSGGTEASVEFKLVEN